MNQFLDDLEFFCTESLKPPAGLEYQSALNVICSVEPQLEAALGREALRQYSDAVYRVHHWELLQTFRAGLRFGADFVLTVWGQSSQTAEP